MARYLIVSAMGVRDPAARGERDAPLLRGQAPGRHRRSPPAGLDYTIVRPGRLTDDPGTGLVEARRALERAGQIPRDDVAATLSPASTTRARSARSSTCSRGETPIAEAIAAL